MLLRFFRSTGAQMLVFILTASLFLWLHSFIKPSASLFVFDHYPMPSYKLVSEIFAPGSLLGSLLTFALVIAQAALLVRLNTRFIIINNRTYLPAIIYIFITALIPDFQRLNPVIFSGFFMLISLELMFNAHRKEKEAYEFFTAAFFISLGSTFYPFLIFLLPVVWCGLFILRPFYWRELVFTFLGFFLPWFFVFSYYYLLHDEPYRIINDFTSLFNASYTAPKYSSLIYVLGVYIIFLILVASQFILKGYGAKKILSRKAFLLFLLMFLNIILVYILIPQASLELIFLAAIPISYLLAHYFAFVRSVKWGNFFLFLLMIFLVLIHIKYFG